MYRREAVRVSFSAAEKGKKLPQRKQDGSESRKRRGKERNYPLMSFQDSIRRAFDCASRSAFDMNGNGKARLLTGKPLFIVE
nr:hypothetical protein [Mixta theicola]